MSRSSPSKPVPMSVLQDMENELWAYLQPYMTLTEQERQVILDFDIFRAYPRGTVLLEEGKRSRDYYFVLKGCIRSFAMIDGEERTLEFYTEKASIVPHCVVSQAPSNHALSCMEDCLLTVGNPDMEAEVFARFPRFESLCRLLSEEKLAQSLEEFTDFKTTTAEQRYRKLLLTRPDLPQRVPQYQLASYLGIQPETLSRIRKRLLKP